MLVERRLLETSFDYHEIVGAISSAASNGGLVRAEEAFWWFFLRNPEMLEDCTLEYVRDGEKIRLRIAGAERSEKVLG